jgi:hypothetical protein
LIPEGNVFLDGAGDSDAPLEESGVLADDDLRRIQGNSRTIVTAAPAMWAGFRTSSKLLNGKVGKPTSD